MKPASHGPSLKRHVQSSSCPGAPPFKVPQHGCSVTEHADVPASSYCSACSRFFCKECEGLHAQLFSDHTEFISTDLSALRQIFTGRCPDHPDSMLEYLCCTHKTLCCARCRLNKDGGHTSCEAVQIEEYMCDELPDVAGALQKRILVVKKDKLELLKNRQIALGDHLNDAKFAVENAFTEIHSLLDKRKNELMDELDNAYNDCSKDDIIAKINCSHCAEDALDELDNAFGMYKESARDKVRLINVVNCVCNAKKALVSLSDMENEIDSAMRVENVIGFFMDKKVADQLKCIGHVLQDNSCACSWKICPENVSKKRKYSTPDNNLCIARKDSNDDSYCTITSSKNLPSDMIVSWSIKLVQSRFNGGDVFAGVAPFDISQDDDDNFKKCGWYFCCFDSTLWSGPPHNYSGNKEYGPRKKKGEYVHTGDSVGVVMNMANGNLSFILDGVNLGVAYEGIPLDKPLVPCVLLHNQYDSVQIENLKIKENISKEVSAPVNVAATSTTHNSIILTWDAVDEVSSYQVEIDARKRYGVSTVNSYKWGGIPQDTEHTFRIRTVKGNSLSEWSDPVRGRTQKWLFKYCWWEECSSDVDRPKNYNIDEKNPRVATKIDDEHCAIIWSDSLAPSKVSSWGIKVLKTGRDDGRGIYLGVSVSGMRREANRCDVNGWYLHCYDLALLSGPPHNYRGNNGYGPKKEDGKYVRTGDSIGVIMDTTRGELSFVLNGVDLGVAYDGIPLDKPLVPCVFLETKDDSVELDATEVNCSVDNSIVKPQITVLKNTWDLASISWLPIVNASFYQVEVDRKRTLHIATSNTFTEKKPAPDAELSFRVRAVCGGNMSGWSDAVKIGLKKVLFSECVWKKCPEHVKEDMMYTIDPKNLRAASSNLDGWCTIIGNAFIGFSKVTTWYIKMLKSKNKFDKVYVGVAPFDINQGYTNYDKCGWYLDCYDSTLWSGPPHNYKGNKEYGPRKKKGQYVHTGDGVGVVMDTAKGELSFVLNGVNLGVAFEGIPLDKPLVPCVLLYWKYDKVELDLSPGLPKAIHLKMQWKNCPENICVNRKYSVSGKGFTIATKSSKNDFYCTVVGNKLIPINKISRWGIRILETLNNDGSGIYVGVAPSDINQDVDDNSWKCGWYFQWYSSRLLSGPPHNYRGKEYGARNGKSTNTGNGIGIVMDAINGELSFILNGVNLGVAYEGIPLDKPLVPCALLWNNRDSVEIENTPYQSAVNGLKRQQERKDDCLLQ